METKDWETEEWLFLFRTDSLVLDAVVWEGGADGRGEVAER